ncbi:hypothetical protein DFJ73DRAFT_798683, partial [Zopfochytrium polystomum]
MGERPAAPTPLGRTSEWALHASLYLRSVLRVTLSALTSAALLSSLALVEQALRTAPPPQVFPHPRPDSPSFYAIVQPTLGLLLTVALNAVKESPARLGARKIAEWVALRGLLFVPCAAMVAVVAGCTRSRTEVLAAAPLVNLPSVVLTIPLIEFPHEPLSRQIIECLSISVPLGLMNAAVFWFVAALSVVADYGDSPGLVQYVLNALTVLASLFVQFLVLAFLGRFLTRESVKSGGSAGTKSSLLNSVARSLATLASPNDSSRESAVCAASMPIMLVITFLNPITTVIILRIRTDQPTTFFLFAAAFITFKPLQDALALLWHLSRRRPTSPPCPTSFLATLHRAAAARDRPYTTLHTRTAVHASN